VQAEIMRARITRCRGISRERSVIRAACPSQRLLIRQPRLSRRQGQTIGLDQHAVISRLRPGKKAHKHKRRAKQQAYQHHPTVRVFVVKIHDATIPPIVTDTANRKSEVFGRSAFGGAGAGLPRPSLSGAFGGNQLIFQNLVAKLAEAGIGPNPVTRTVAPDFLNLEPITFAQRNTGFDLGHEAQENGDAGGDQRAKGDG
jgi:hypothetical protein